MKNTLGNNVSITIFGESHGNALGAVLDGIAPGIEVDESFIAHQLDLRRPVGKISTPRKETDEFEILSGVFNGVTTGTPICIVIKNKDKKSEMYESIKDIARPSHADYTAFCKYNGFADYRGGGHFSGRVTAGIVAVGAIALLALKNKGIEIGTHIAKCGGIEDAEFSDYKKDIENLNNKIFATLDDEKAEEMKAIIKKAASCYDSVGGLLETAVIGLPAGVGEPWFAIADMMGSKANDSFYAENGQIYTETNNNGGINGGITNGMPVIFRTAIKPTPSISLPQKTVNFKSKLNIIESIIGRHDPCIVHRARVVVDSITAIVLCDMLATKFGTDWLSK